MKEFLLKIALFFFIIAGIDFLMGICFDYMASKSTLTDFGRDNHICNTGTEDLLVFGSSRALHHYNTGMMTDSLGIACYNCGEDGQGIILNYGRLQMLKQRHEPKVIIYDLEPNYDVNTCDNHQFIKWLKPHCNRKGVMDIIASVDSTERFKLLSRLYRYNTEFLTLLTAMKHVGEQEKGTGYNPLSGTLNEAKKNAKHTPASYESDSLKLHYLEAMIQTFDDATILFVVSPAWNGKDMKSLEPAKRLCDKYKISFIDYSNSPKYVHQDKYYTDVVHLNNRGADEFTKDIITILKDIQ